MREKRDVERMKWREKWKRTQREGGIRHGEMGGK